MSYFLVGFGALLLIAAARNTQGCLFTLLQGDLFGGGSTALSKLTGGATASQCGSVANQSNFFYWFVAILLIGSIGYSKKLKPISDGFLVLVILVLFISNKGFFAQFQAALAKIQSSTKTPIANASSAGVSIAVDTVPQSTSVNNSTTTIATNNGGNSNPITSDPCGGFGYFDPVYGCSDPYGLTTPTAFTTPVTQLPTLPKLG